MRAYHLARQLLNEAEREVLASRFSGEEDEALAFGLQSVGVEEPGVIQAIFRKLWDMFARIGNMLRGRGYQTVDDIFDRVRQGQVAHRSHVDQAFGQGADSFSTSVPDGKRIGSVSKKFNELDESDQSAIARLREELGMPPQGGVRIEMEATWAEARKHLASESELKRIFARQATYKDGQMTAELATWRYLNYRTRKLAALAAKELEADQTNRELMASFADAAKLWSEVYLRYDAMASETGRALHLFRTPVSELGTAKLARLDAMRELLDRGEHLPPMQIGGTKVDMEDLRGALDELEAENEDYGAKVKKGHPPHGLHYASLKQLLDTLRADELLTLVEQWSHDRGALRRAIAAILEADRIAEEAEAGKAGPKRDRTAYAKFLFYYYQSILSAPTTLF